MTEANHSQNHAKTNWLRIVSNLFVCLLVLGGAVAAVIWINQTEPTAKKLNSTRKSAALVETITATSGTYSPKLTVLGTVQSAQQISLRPRITGQIVELAAEFVPGGTVREGQLLMRIDPADFENALSISESELDQAKASMEIEKARQSLAKKELKLLEGTIDETNRSLVLREPQIASMQAEISAAEASVDRAQLDLDRTKIYAPFDAQILSRNINIGSQVGPGDELGQLVGLQEYWVMAAVPVRSLRWVDFPKIEQPNETLLQSGSPESESSWQDQPGSKVILRNPDAWGPDVQREARVVRLIGTLDNETRLARVLISVSDPMGEETGAPPLILNTLLQTEIEGRPIENVVRLERGYLRDQDTVWVMKEDKLEIRETEIVFRDAQYAYIRSGLNNGDEIVITTLATVAPGVGLRKANGLSSAATAPEVGQ